MTAKKLDLLSIANADLAKKLSQKEELASLDNTEKADENTANNFQHDKWLAVTLLNVFRYIFAAVTLAVLLFPMKNDTFLLNVGHNNPFLFKACVFCLLLSAIAFTLLSRQKKVPFNFLISTQLFSDVIFAGLIVYSSGGIESKYVILYFLVVATGSVVLTHKAALGLASGCVIALFYQHFYNQLISTVHQDPKYSLLALLSVGLLTAAFAVSYLAHRIQQAERRGQTFIPGSEGIEDYLKREEKSALIAALNKTHGNKTNAAKLLGLTFRSFRYKLTKYKID